MSNFLILPSHLFTGKKHKYIYVTKIKIKYIKKFKRKGLKTLLMGDFGEGGGGGWGLFSSPISGLTIKKEKKKF